MAYYTDLVQSEGYNLPIPGVQVYVFNADGSLASLTNGTGASIVNPVITDATGRFSFNAADNVYRAQFRFGGQTIREDSLIVGTPSQYVGPTGPSNNTRVSLDVLKSAATTDLTSLYNGSLWTWTAGDFSATPTSDLNVWIVQANSTPLNQGAWVRQKATGVSVQLDGGRTRAVADELSDTPVSAARFPTWGTDYAAAIRAAIATGKDVYIPFKGTLLLTSSLGTTQPNQRIFGRGKGLTVLQKAFNGDIVTLDVRSSITDISLDGDGGNFTGRGVVVTSGDSAVGTGYQRIDRVSIVRMQGYCVEWTQNAAGWGGGMLDCDVRRSNDTQACLKMPATETNGNRCLINVFAGSGPLIDFDGAANVQVVACVSGSYSGAINAFRTTKNCAKIQIIGGRYAVGGGTTSLLGVNHTVVGISHAGPFILGDGTTNSLANSKGSGNDFAGYSVTDNSATDTASVNAFDKPLSIITPTWTATGTAPAIGNGLLAAAISRSGGHVTIDCDLEAGSSTTFGTGAWTFSTPLKNFGRRACGAAWMFDSSAGVPIYIGAAVIEPGALSIQVYPHQANVVQSTSPFTWATGDKLSFTITYLAG